MKARFFQHPSALVETDRIGTGTRIWAFAHVLKGAKIGRDCNIGDHAFVEGGATIGHRVTVKNAALVWDGCRIGDDVFLGPGCVFTNDLFPRSPRFDVVAERYREPAGWRVETHVGRGASVGANATIRCGIRIGSFAMIGAGAVVTEDVAPFALVLGVPARQVGWVSEAGARIEFSSDGTAVCPQTARRYRLVRGKVTRAR